MRKRNNRLAGVLLSVMLLALILPGPVAFAAAPGIVISTPADYSVTDKSSVEISGYVTDTTTLRINNADVSFDANGFFYTIVSGLSLGNNPILITATGPSGTTNKLLTVTYDPNAGVPVITVSSPADYAEVNTGTVTVTGRVYNNSSLTISVNGVTAYSGADNGDFSHSVSVSPGDNTIILAAEKTGVRVTNTLHVKYNRQAVITDVSVNSLPVNDYTAVTATPATVDGNAVGATALTVYNNGSVVPSTFTGGSFTSAINLAAGANNVSIVAEGPGLYETRSILIYYGPAGPQVYNVTPAGGSTVYGTSVTVSGTFRDASSVKVNGVSVFSSAANSSGSFSQQSVSLTGKQWNTITIVAANTSGGATTHSYNIYSETDPAIFVDKPAVGAVVYSNTVTVSGRVYNTVSGGLTVNGAPVYFDSAGGFNRIVTLKPGVNTVTVSARNPAGVTVTKNVTVEYRGGPAIYNLLPVSGTVVSTGTVTVTGTVANTSADGLKINGTPVSFGSNGNFNKPLRLNHGLNTVTVTATDGIATATSTIQITYDASPVIIVTSPENNALAVNNSVNISGKVFNTETNGFLVNGTAVPFNAADGGFSTNVDLPNLINDIRLEAYKGNLFTTTNLRVYYSAVPAINITSHSSGDTVDAADVVIEGTVFPVSVSEIDTFTVKGVDCKSKIVNGAFKSLPISLSSGENEIEIALTTKALGGGILSSRSVSRKIKLNYNTGPSISVSSPLDGSTVYSNTVTIYGRLTRADLNTLKIGDKNVKVSSDGSFEYTVTLQNGKNEIKLSAGLLDATTTKTMTVYYSPIGRDGAVVRTKLEDGGEAKAFDDMIKVKVPKGSTGSGTTSVLTVTDPADLDHPPQQSAFVGPVFRLSWEGDKPLKPYKVTLKFDSVVRENQTHKVTILYYNDDGDEWEVLGGAVDAKGRTVSIDTEKTGYFAAAVYFKTFDDVNNHWAQRDIEFLVARGAISGESSDRFNPDGNITRAEFVTFLVKALGIEPYKPERESYSDVDEDHWAYQYIEAALRAGLVTGVSHDRFAPNRYITRQEAGVLLARAGNLKTPKDQEVTKIYSSFSDAGIISPWAKNELAAAIKAKILNGSDNGYFLPLRNTTRAQAAAMISRLTEVTVKSRSTGK